MGNDLPLIRNNGRYGELGHWGKRSGRRFTKKKILLLGALLSLSLIFAISHNYNVIPIVNAGDYNTSFSHTRTNIFTDRNFNGPVGATGPYTFNSKVNGSISGMSTSLPALTVTSGDTIVLTMIGSNSFDFGCSVASAIAISDTQTNSYTLRVQSPDVVGGGANTCIYTASASATGSDTITISTAPHNEIWQSITAMDYSGTIGIGTTGTEQRTVNPTDSSTIALTVGSASSLIIEAFELQLPAGTVIVTETSGQTIRNSNTPTTQPMLTTDVSGFSGSSNIKVSWVISGTPCTTPNFCRLSHSALELTFHAPDFSQVRYNYNSTCVQAPGGKFVFTYLTGNTIGVPATLDSFHPSPVTSLYGSASPIPGVESSFFAQSFTFAGLNWQIGSVQFEMNQTASWTGAWVAQIWKIQGTPGTDAIPIGTGGNTNPSSSGNVGFPIGASLASSNPFAGPLTSVLAPITFTFPTSPILLPGSYMVSLTTNSSIASAASPLINNSLPGGTVLVRTAFGDGAPAYAGHNVYLPRTGQMIRTTKAFWFTVTGLNTNPAINCNSADILITKTSFNLQTASAKMLEMDQAMEAGATFTAQGFMQLNYILRTNGTLPSFSENYYAWNDTQNRLIWTVCANPNDGSNLSKSCAFLGGAGSPYLRQGLFIAHDQRKSIQSETFGNDFIISSTTPQFIAGNIPQEQVVLNFTGPVNYISSQFTGISTNSSINSASQLQQGQDYYLVIQAVWNPATQPNAGGATDQRVFWSTQSGIDSMPPALGIFSVPASCSDPLNRVACGYALPQPTFDFNPLDPSSWGNAIIKGLLWVFSVAVPSGLLIIAQVLLQVIQITFNFVGNQFGWGNIGDNIVAYLSSLPTLFGQIGTALGWFANIVSSLIQTIIIANLLSNPYFAGLVNVLNDFKNAIGSGIILSFLTEIAFWFPTSYMIILISTYFLFVFLKGLSGFFEWLHIVKWSSFAIVSLFAIFIEHFVDLITAILGRLSIISPGHKFPKIPHPHPGEIPKISLHGEIAFFDDPTAWFLAFTGFIFTMMWAGTTSAGLPANTQTVIQAMTPLFTTLFGVGFMILILYIPGFLLGKLHEKGIIS